MQWAAAVDGRTDDRRYRCPEDPEVQRFVARAEHGSRHSAFRTPPERPTSDGCPRIGLMRF